MTEDSNQAAFSDDEQERIAKIPLTPQEESFIVRLASERSCRELYCFDQGVKARALNGLVEKGLAETIEGGWKLTKKGQIRCTSIY